MSDPIYPLIRRGEKWRLLENRSKIIYFKTVADPIDFVTPLIFEASLRFSPKRVAAELGLRPQTVLAKNSRFVCDVPARGMSAKCPLFHSDLGAIGAAAGDLRSTPCECHLWYKVKISQTPSFWRRPESSRVSI